jgi:hypothetical protein
MNTNESARRYIKDKIKFLTQNFFLVEDYLHSKGLTDKQIHIFHISLLAKNFEIAGEALGITRVSFSKLMSEIYDIFNIEDNNKKSKFFTLVGLVYSEVSDPNYSSTYYKTRLNPAQRIQILLAMQLEERYLYVIQNNIQKIFPEKRKTPLIAATMKAITKLL